VLLQLELFGAQYSGGQSMCMSPTSWWLDDDSSLGLQSPASLKNFGLGLKDCGLGLGLEASGLGLGLEACGLGLDLGLGGSGLVNIPAQFQRH